jgi:pimeloyl-ACP methyl ester carboxylesterase
VAGDPEVAVQAKQVRWIGGLLAAAVLVLGGCATLDEQQRKWIFQPSKDNWGGTSADGMQDRWIEFTPPGAEAPVKLHALWMPQANADAPVMLYLHGARWGVTSSSFRMRRLHALGVSVLGVDYRGFGLSTDALPSETTAYQDARAAWDWLRAQYPRRQRLIYGHSLGSAIAIHLAAEVDDEAGVVVEGGFTSVPDVFSTMRFGWLPLKPLITQRFDAAQRIAEVGSPVLVVHGAQDRMIQPALGRALYEQAREPKRFILAENGTHHNAQAMVSDQVRDAMHSLFGLPSGSSAAE